jgi:hypothetical protein
MSFRVLQSQLSGRMQDGSRLGKEDLKRQYIKVTA